LAALTPVKERGWPFAFLGNVAACRRQSSTWRAPFDVRGRRHSCGIPPVVWSQLLAPPAGARPPPGADSPHRALPLGTHQCWRAVHAITSPPPCALPPGTPPPPLALPCGRPADARTPPSRPRDLTRAGVQPDGRILSTPWIFDQRDRSQGHDIQGRPRRGAETDASTRGRASRARA